MHDMARSKSRSRAIVVRRAPAPKPIVIRTTKVVKHKHRHGGRRRGGLGMGGLFSKDRITTVAAGWAVGMLEKMDFVKNLPHLPFLGTTGTVGLAAYLLSDNGRNRMAADISLAALTVSGYMLGSTGTIVGDATADGYVAGF